MIDRPPFGKDPNAPGGINWELDKARLRVAYLDASLAHLKKELSEAVIDLENLERQAADGSG